MKTLALVLAALLITGCDKNETSSPHTDAAPEVTSEASVAPETASRDDSQTSLDQILDAQSDETKARYAFRHPKETLEFFRIQPGMTVVEVLPGEGWYSQILVPYLGKEGQLIGLDYDGGMWKNFDWVTDDFMASRKQWPSEWTGKVSGWGGENAAQASAFALEDAPESLNGTVDAVLFIRALHNFFRFESQGGHLTQALEKTKELLKPGGLVGIVQHQASEEKTDEWADGSRGYVKKSALIAKMEAAGFEFIAESDINSNLKDVPGEDDSVWRLPPSYSTSKDNEELKKQFTEMGESNRMTLLFRKSE